MKIKVQEFELTPVYYAIVICVKFILGHFTGSLVPSSLCSPCQFVQNTQILRKVAKTIVSIPVIHKIMSLGNNETRVVNNPLHQQENI